MVLNAWTTNWPTTTHTEKQHEKRITPIPNPNRILILSPVLSSHNDGRVIDGTVVDRITNYSYN